MRAYYFHDESCIKSPGAKQKMITEVKNRPQSREDFLKLTKLAFQDPRKDKMGRGL